MAEHPLKKFPEVRDWLTKTKVKEVETSHSTVVEVSPSMTPLEAAKHLWENKVLGAPVWDESQKKYIGFFDVRDLLSTVLQSHKQEAVAEEKAPTKDQFVYTKWFNKKPLDTMPGGGSYKVSYLAARNPFVSVTEDTPLLEVCRLSAARHAHRVPVVDPATGRCIRIISQATLVKFISKNLMNEKTMSPELKAYLDQTLAQAQFPFQKDIVTAPDTATACEVFELMDNKRLSGIAIVDAEDGAHVGSTNASDIRLAAAVDDESPTFDLGLNILSYLSGARQVEPTKNDPYPMAHVKESSTLTHVIKMLAKTGMHRVFVVDSFLVPVGVIGVSDIVGFLVAED